MKLIKFLLGAFTDKEGAARSSASIMAAVAACWFIFTPIVAFESFKAGQDAQNRLLWKDQAMIRDTLAAHGIYVPTLTADNDNETNTLYGKN